MANFEGYARREAKILATLKEYGINSIDECQEICAAKGIDPYKIVEERYSKRIRAIAVFKTLVCNIIHRERQHPRDVRGALRCKTHRRGALQRAGVEFCCSLTPWNNCKRLLSSRQ